jgi:hypothetical protein
MLTEGACGGKEAEIGGKAGALEGIRDARAGIAEGEPEVVLCWDGGWETTVAGVRGAITSRWTGMTKSAAAAI